MQCQAQFENWLILGNIQKIFDTPLNPCYTSLINQHNKPQEIKMNAKQSTQKIYEVRTTTGQDMSRPENKGKLLHMTFTFKEAQEKAAQLAQADSNVYVTSREVQN